MRILFFIPSLEYGGAARQLVLLATGLPRTRFTLRVCTMGRPAPWVETLRAADIGVEVWSWNRIIDVQPWLRLRRTARDFRPDVTHVWGLPALFYGTLLRYWGGGRLLISAALPSRDRPRRFDWLDRWLLRPKRYQVVASGPAEAERCTRLGHAPERIVQVPPGVALPAPFAPAGPAVRSNLGLPAAARLLVGVGPLEADRGFHDAIWALDILKFLYRDVHLVLIGQGPDRPRLERFARAIDVAGEVHFAGCLPDVQPLLGEAEAVWVPSRTPGGVNVALEAMAAGRPVVAARLPGLAEVVADGETGLLFPPGDKAMLARQTRLLLDDAGRRRRMGEAGRKRVETHFSVGELVRRCSELYEGR